MRIVVITQDDPFYLSENLDYLIRNCPKHSKIVGAIVLEASPFGKKTSFSQKVKETYQIFGAGFFVHYGVRFIVNKLNPAKSVKRTLGKFNVPTIAIEGSINKAENLEKIRSVNPDLLISIAGNQIFKRPLIELASQGCLNLHTALLPKYRGLMPSFWVLKNGEPDTGVSIFFVDEGIDSGPILIQRKVEISGQSQEQLIFETKRIGMECMIEAINKIESGDKKVLPNSDSESSYFSFPTKEDVKEFKKKRKRFF
jgi:methionyl-tRNA formyltransferase